MSPINLRFIRHSDFE